jgi:hypothetical protein
LGKHKTWEKFYNGNQSKTKTMMKANYDGRMLEGKFVEEIWWEIQKVLMEIEGISRFLRLGRVFWVRNDFESETAKNVRIFQA